MLDIIWQDWILGTAFVIWYIIAFISLLLHLSQNLPRIKDTFDSLDARPVVEFKESDICLILG